MLDSFDSFNLKQIPRSKNSHVDSLATLATSTGERLPMIILVENLFTPTYDKLTLVGVNFTRVCPSWMDPIMSFLKDGTLLEDRNEVEKTLKKVSRY